MKRLLLLLNVCLFFHLTSHAQNFFYLENGNATEKEISAELVKASQYVTKSPLASDYIITASAGVRSGTNTFNLKMTMQDSVTYKTIFQSSEDYTLPAINANTRIFLKLMMSGFIEKNISQIIYSARDDHFNLHGKFLKAGKDKT
jgi:hypothetical protein